MIPNRRHLPDTRKGLTHKFRIGELKGYINVGLFDDGTPGEVFLHIAKEGSTLSGMTDSFAIMLSIALQYGIPLKDLVRKFRHVRFEPEGLTGNKDIPTASSIIDYLFAWLEKEFLNKEHIYPGSYPTEIEEGG